MLPVHSGSRRNVCRGALVWLRLSGVAVAAVCILAHAFSRTSFIDPEVQQQVELLVTGGSAEWEGCRITLDPMEMRARIRFDFSCQGQSRLTVRLDPLVVRRAADDCLAGTSAGNFLSCNVEGTLDQPTRTRLLSRLRSALSEIITTDPVRSSSAWARYPFFYWPVEWLLVSLFWLLATGAFGYAGLTRNDWPVLVPLAAAVVVRVGFTLHSIQEIEVEFARDAPVVRHSVLYPMLQQFYDPWVRDGQWWTLHVNGLLSALTVLPIFLLVRHRTDSRVAACVVGLFYACQPVVARFACSDGPYALLLFTLFSGLALMAAPVVKGPAFLAAFVLVGIAAACREEGALPALGGFLLLDLRRLWAQAREESPAAFMGVAIVGTIAWIHFDYVLGNDSTRVMQTAGQYWNGFGLVLHELAGAQPTWLLGSAVAGGLAFGRWRMGVGAVGAAFLSELLVAPSADWIVSLHRVTPCYAFAAIAAGLGASWPFISLRWPGGRWMAAVPGSVLSLLLLWQHRAILGEPTVFTEEYSLARETLAPGGKADPACVVLTLTPPDDSDIHNYGQVLPGMPVLDCRTADCLGALSRYRCVYYIRTLACFGRRSKERPMCRLHSGDAQVPTSCLEPPCAALEEEASIDPLATRRLEVQSTFPDVNFPETALFGIYRVHPARH